MLCEKTCFWIKKCSILHLLHTKYDDNVNKAHTRTLQHGAYRILNSPSCHVGCVCLWSMKPGTNHLLESYGDWHRTAEGKGTSNFREWIIRWYSLRTGVYNFLAWGQKGQKRGRTLMKASYNHREHWIESVTVSSNLNSQDIFSEFFSHFLFLCLTLTNKVLTRFLKGRYIVEKPLVPA